MDTRMLSLAVVAAAALAGPVQAWQVPTKPGQLPTQPPVPLPPAISVHSKCLRPDVQQTKAAIGTSLAQPRQPGVAPPEVTEAVKETAGCTYYKVTLASTMTIEDTETPGVSSTIAGQGSITFGLAPDDGMAGYDFTSGIQDLTAPIYWTKGSARILRPNCIVTTVELPYTLFSFWLGVTSSPTQKLGVAITPAGNELHSVATRCKDPLGRWHDLPNSEESIFTPAWIKLHGEGKNTVAPTADQQALTDMTNSLGKAGPKPGAKMPTLSSPTGAMDMSKLQAMQDYMTKHPNATPAEMMKQMAGVVPNLDQQLAAAEDNFMFTAPGECAAVNAVKTVCSLSGTPVTMKDRTGYGTIKKITEQTTITIEKVSPPPGAP